METFGRCLPPESGKFCTLFYTPELGITRRPFVIRVGYGDVMVRPAVGLEVDNEPAAGSWTAVTRTIALSLDEHIADQAVVLVHEMLHAIWSTYQLPEDLSGEEAIVTALSGPLAALLRDNPMVAAGICNTLAHGHPIFGSST